MVIGQRAWVLCGLCAGAMAACQPALAQADQAADAVFDDEGYYRLRVTMAFDAETDRFSGAYCPENSLLAFQMSDVLRSDGAHTLTLAVQSPNYAATELELYNVSVSRSGGFFGIGSSQECTATFNRVDYRSPLLPVARGRDVPWTIGVRLVKHEDAPLLVNLPLPALPFQFLLDRDAIETKLSEAWHNTNRIMNTTTLRPTEGANQEESWSIPGNPSQGIPEVTITAALEPYQSYFVRPAAGWNPNTVFSAATPVDSPGGLTNFGDLLQSLDGYIAMVSTNDPGGFFEACRQLASGLSTLGFSPSDQALMVWATARGRSNLRENAAIYTNPCMSDVFNTLHARADTRDISSTPVTAVGAPRPADEAAMRATLDTNPPLFGFLYAQSWSNRRDHAVRLFDWTRPVTVVDSAGIGHMDSVNLQLENADQWQLRHAGGAVRFAQNVGCHLYRLGSDTTPSSAVAIADFGTPDAPREAIIAMEFAPVLPGSAARVSRIEFAEVDNATLAAMRQAYTDSCDILGWRAQSLEPQVLNLDVEVPVSTGSQ